jgi:hypothetical protein
MGAIRQDFILWRGTAPTIQDTVLKDDGTPEDVNNWTAQLTLRPNGYSPNPVTFSKALAPFGPTIEGKLRATLTKTETLTIPAGKYAFTIERTNTGNEDVLTYGYVTVRHDILNAVA